MAKHEREIAGMEYKAPYPAFDPDALPTFPMAENMGGKCVEVRMKSKAVVERGGKQYDRYELVVYFEYPAEQEAK